MRVDTKESALQFGSFGGDLVAKEDELLRYPVAVKPALPLTVGFVGKIQEYAQQGASHKQHPRERHVFGSLRRFRMTRSLALRDRGLRFTSATEGRWAREVRSS